MEDIRPTAKWANRMLRPLASIYHRLEKHHEIVASVSILKPRERPATRVDIDKTRATARVGARVEGCSYPDDEEPNDPAWIPGKPEKRRIRHNYSSRGQRNGARRRSRLSILSPDAQKTLPGAIEIATPLITGKSRVMGEGESSSSSSLRRQLFHNNMPRVEKTEENEHRRRTNNSSFPVYHGSWKEVLDHSGDPSFVDIALLLDRVFLKFLRNTRASRQNEAAERGSRSLFSMAVRRLPDFIADEQRLQDELDEGGEVNMCDAYFTELEASYAPTGNGWQPLREASRAQGIYLVSEMVRNRWITDLAACRLLEECLSQKEFDAFESLLSTYLARVRTYHYPAAFDPPRLLSHSDDPVHILGTYYVRFIERRSYAFSEITKLLTRGVLPPEWMVTTLWKRCVDGAIKSFSAEDSDSATARRLIEAVILSSTGVYSSPTLPEAHSGSIPVRPRETRTSATLLPTSTRTQLPCPVPIQDALSNLIASLNTALCGMCIARSKATAADTRLAGSKIRAMVSHLSLVVQRAISLERLTHEYDELSCQALRRGYSLLADCILYCEITMVDTIYHFEPTSKRVIESFFWTLASRPDVVKSLAGLVTQVFHYSGHAQNQGPSRTPWEIRNKVSQLSRLGSDAGASLFLGKVAAETAMELAEKSLDPEDHTWAVEIQERAVSSQRGQSLEESPSSGHKYSSDETGLYRWEDSIGEWVASTPAIRSRVANLQGAPKSRAPRVVVSQNKVWSTSSSSPSSTCSDESISSMTSSAPSVTKKRSCATEDLSPRPCKRNYHTRSMEALAHKTNDSPDAPGSSRFKSSSEPSHVPVAARTRTALRQLLHTKNMTGRQIRSPPTALRPVSKIEVVIVNQRTPMSAFQDSDREPVSSRTRRSSLPIKIGVKLPLKRRLTQGAVPLSRRQTMAFSSQDDDSDDELSFL